MMTSFAVFVESNTSGTGPLFFAAAHRLGHEPILLAMNPSKYNFLAGADLRVVKCDTSNKECLLDVCHSLMSEGTIAGVLTSSEYFVATVAALCSELKLNGPSLAAVETCRNKAMLRQTLKNLGLENVRFAEVRDPFEVRRAIAETGLPVVVKPVAGSGSLNVRLCRSEEAAFEHVERCLCESAPASVLLEQYISGPEYSVEVFNGEPVGITRKYLGEEPFFVETGHDFPAALDAGMEDELVTYVRRVCEKVGVSWGPVHVELKLDSLSRPHIIEINPRLAGGFIPELVRLATGIDLVEETVRLATGAECRVKATGKKHAAIRFVIPRENGHVEKVNGTSSARMVPGVSDVRLYQSVPIQMTLHGDFRDRIGHVIAVSADTQTTKAAVTCAHELVSLSYAKAKDKRLEEKVHECA